MAYVKRVESVEAWGISIDAFSSWNPLFTVTKNCVNPLKIKTISFTVASLAVTHKALLYFSCTSGRILTGPFKAKLNRILYFRWVLIKLATERT